MPTIGEIYKNTININEDDIEDFKVNGKYTNFLWKTRTKHEKMNYITYNKKDITKGCILWMITEKYGYFRFMLNGHCEKSYFKYNKKDHVLKFSIKMLNETTWKWYVNHYIIIFSESFSKKIEPYITASNGDTSCKKSSKKPSRKLSKKMF
jgi:hypothetical protein